MIGWRFASVVAVGRRGWPWQGARLGALVLAGTLLWTPVWALEGLSLELGPVMPSVQGKEGGWSVGRARLLLDGLDEACCRYRLRLEDLRLGSMAELGLPRRLSWLELRCDNGRLGAHELACERGRLSWSRAAGVLALVDSGAATLDFHWDWHSGALRLALPRLALAGGELARLRLSWDGRAWALKTGLKGVDLKRLVGRLSAALGATESVALHEGLASLSAGLSVGYLSGSVNLGGGEQGLRRADVELAVTDLALANASGSMAVEGLGLSLDVRLARQRGASAWGGTLGLRVDRGQALVDAAFVDFDALGSPLRLALDGQGSVAGLSRLKARLDWPVYGAIEAQGDWLLGDASGKGMVLSWESLDLARLYGDFAQPFLAGTAAEDLLWEGQLGGWMRLDQGGLAAVNLRPQALFIADGEGRFALNGLSGRFRWDRDKAQESLLHVEGGRLLAIDLGEFDLGLSSDNRVFSLSKALQLPVWDGALVVDRFSVDASHEGLPAWELSGYLTPVSMELVAEAFAWPTMGGQLSGMVPSVAYKAGRLTVDGILLARAFDGAVTVRDLVIERPFGISPRLSANARLQGLDLEVLTRTFSFGRIQGRLDGQLDGLVLEAWQPAAFDLSLASPADDDKPHRISQQAVSDLTQIGGGGLGGALSGGFLSLFDNFWYDRLGFSCRLRRNVCSMDGVAEGKDGSYFLVKGGGIPRIDVMGFQRDVDWQVLLARVKAATAVKDVVVE